MANRKIYKQVKYIKLIYRDHLATLFPSLQLWNGSAMSVLNALSVAICDSLKQQELGEMRNLLGLKLWNSEKVFLVHLHSQQYISFTHVIPYSWLEHSAFIGEVILLRNLSCVIGIEVILVRLRVMINWLLIWCSSRKPKSQHRKLSEVLVWLLQVI